MLRDKNNVTNLLISVLRAFLIEEQKIVKQVLKTQVGSSPYLL